MNSWLKGWFLEKKNDMMRLREAYNNKDISYFY